MSPVPVNNVREEGVTGAPRSREWLVVAPALVVPFVASLFYFVLFRDSLLAKAIYSATKVFTLVWPVLATVWLLHGRVSSGGTSTISESSVGTLNRAGFVAPASGGPERVGRLKAGLRTAVGSWGTLKDHARAVPLGLASGAAITGGLLTLMLTPLASVVAAGAPSIRAKAETFGILDHYWLFALLLSVAHSLIEEYYWRWFVYGRLRRLVGPGVGHLVAAIAFASHHVVVAAVYFGVGWGLLFGACVGLGGAIWSVMFQRQGTLAGAWVSHMVVDLGILAVGHKVLYGAYF